MGVTLNAARAGDKGNRRTGLRRSPGYEQFGLKVSWGGIEIMRCKALMAGVSLTFLAASAALAQPMAQPANIKAHMTFLADDLMEGREAGSRAYDIAANYVASQFAQLGLKPAGDKGSYFQTVPLAAVRGRDEGRFVVTGKGGEVTLTPGVDVITGKPFGPADLNISAPLVFVGYGIDAPGRDDYRGLDVTGKIVVVMSGAPASLNTEERAYHSNARNKRALAGKHGAVGVISLQTPTDEKRRPFANGANGWKTWSMSWTAPDGQINDARVGPPLLASFSLTGAEKLFAGAKTPYAAAAATAEAGKEPPRFALATSLAATIHTEAKTVKSENVAGLLEGSDPRLKSEVIVLSAHLDHIGISETGPDRINNGALDNASGIATSLEAARLFVQSGKAPRRSVLFLAMTAEEKRPAGFGIFRPQPDPAGRRGRREPRHADPALRFHRRGGLRRRPLEHRRGGAPRRRQDERGALARSHAGRRYLHPVGSLPFRRGRRALGDAGPGLPERRRAQVPRLPGRLLPPSVRRPWPGHRLCGRREVRPDELQYRP
jgi:hypothetical protein